LGEEWRDTTTEYRNYVVDEVSSYTSAEVYPDLYTNLTDSVNSTALETEKNILNMT
jgi:hypothetical protein